MSDAYGMLDAFPRLNDERYSRLRGEVLNERRMRGLGPGWRTLWQRVRSASGQAMVEFALVFVPLALLILGGIDFGSIFKDVIEMRQAVSSADRQAAVGLVGTNSCSLTGVTAANGDSSTPTQADRYLMCLVHSKDGIGDTNARVMIIVGDSSPAGANKYSAGNPPPALPVTICEMYALHSLSGVFSFVNGRIVTTQSTDLVATLDTSDGGLTSAQEAALPGSSWSFCTPPAPVS